MRLVRPLKISVSGVLICAWLYCYWPLKSSHFSDDELRLSCSVGMKVFIVLIEAVVEEAVADGIGDSILQRRAARTAAVEPWQPKADRVDRWTAARSYKGSGNRLSAGVVLQKLRIAEGRFLVDAKIGAKAKAIQLVFQFSFCSASVP